MSLFSCSVLMSTTECYMKVGRRQVPPTPHSMPGARSHSCFPSTGTVDNSQRDLASPCPHRAGPSGQPDGRRPRPTAVVAAVQLSPAAGVAGVADVEALARELIRIWQLALQVVPTVQIGHAGPLTVWFAISGFEDGLVFPARPRGRERQPLSPARYRSKIWPDVPQAMPPDEIAMAMLMGLVRAFEYRRAGAVVQEAVERVRAHLAIP